MSGKKDETDVKTASEIKIREGNVRQKMTSQC